MVLELFSPSIRCPRRGFEAIFAVIETSQAAFEAIFAKSLRFELESNGYTLRVQIYSRRWKVREFIGAIQQCFFLQNNPLTYMIFPKLGTRYKIPKLSSLVVILIPSSI